MKSLWRGECKLRLLSEASMTKWLLVAMCLGSTLPGQDVNEIQPDLSGLKYPPSVRAARIQGAVRFSVMGGHIELISGYPSLALAAQTNLEKWASAYDSN